MHAAYLVHTKASSRHLTNHVSEGKSCYVSKLDLFLVEEGGFACKLPTVSPSCMSHNMRAPEILLLSM